MIDQYVNLPVLIPYLIGWWYAVKYLKKFDDIAPITPVMSIVLVVSWPPVLLINLFIRNVIHKNVRFQNWLRGLK